MLSSSINLRLISNIVTFKLHWTLLSRNQKKAHLKEDKSYLQILVLLPDYRGILLLIIHHKKILWYIHTCLSRSNPFLAIISSQDFIYIKFFFVNCFLCNNVKLLKVTVVKKLSLSSNKQIYLTKLFFFFLKPK